MKLLKYALVNGLAAGVLVGAVFYEYQWALNLLRFASWLMLTLVVFTFLISSVCVALAEHNAEFQISPFMTMTRDILQEIGVPRWLDRTYDFLFVAIMVAFGGLYFTAGAYAMTMLFSHANLENRKKLADIQWKRIETALGSKAI